MLYYKNGWLKWQPSAKTVVMIVLVTVGKTDDYSRAKLGVVTGKISLEMCSFHSRILTTIIYFCIYLYWNLLLQFLRKKCIILGWKSSPLNYLFLPLSILVQVSLGTNQRHNISPKWNILLLKFLIIFIATSWLMPLPSSKSSTTEVLSSFFTPLPLNFTHLIPSTVTI